MDAIGRASLILALLVGLYGIGASVYGARSARREWVTSGRRAVYAVFALAAVLCALYPAGRPVWLVMAAGVALARIHSRRHFMEDTLFGGGAGWLLATWTFTWRWPGQLARRLGL